jgi:hypothetical protein
MKLQNFKKETARKEKETLLLYQSSLQKFGNTVKVASPAELMTPVKVSVQTSPKRKSPIATQSVSELTKAFETETGVPDFLFSRDSSSGDNKFKEGLQEILEERALPDPEGAFVRCESPKARGSGSITAVESDEYEVYNEEEDDDLSVLTGFTTLNSAKTREVLQEADNEVTDFIKSKREYIQKMMEQEDTASTNSPSVVSRSHSQAGSVSNDSALASEAEGMVKKMENVLKEYEHQKSEISKQLQTIAAPRRIEAGRENEV